MESNLPMSTTFDNAEQVMRRAIELARRGTGFVEPNPLVGCVIVNDSNRLIAEGWHPRFGGPHAEVTALHIAGDYARGATMYVTLEPCSHHGKTPPCADAVIASGIKKVVIATIDPAPHVAGSGIKRLHEAGIEVETGLLEADAKKLIAPFVKLVTKGQPFVHAKWAMTLDGKIATRTGSSMWISNADSRKKVHQLRAQMDGILTGIGTVLADDPLLTARPSGPRVPARIILDRKCQLPETSQLVQTAGEIPVILFVGSTVDEISCKKLAQRHVEIVRLPEIADDQASVHEIEFVLNELGRRQMTNILVEGGSRILGAFHDANAIDEVHCFVAPKLVGGSEAMTPVAGTGLELIPQTPQLDSPEIEVIGEDVYLRGRTRTK